MAYSDPNRFEAPTQSQPAPTDHSDGWNETWIEDLARNEIAMEETGVVEFNEHVDQKYLLEESAIEVLGQLRTFFEEYADSFNRYRGTSQGPFSVKIYQISGTPSDFMLFRNSLKLIVSNPEVGVIRIAFNSNTGGVFGARTNLNSGPEANGHELIAQLGPFNEVIWSYRGTRVNLEQLVRHYLTEFIKNSAR